MARIFCCETFSGKHVAQMSVAVGANDLNSSSVGIRNTLYVSIDLIVKRRPAASGIKLVGSPV
jgi:hypothetical protein